MAGMQGIPVNEWQQGYADTWDVGGSRFGLWAQSAFSPNSYVGTTTTVPLAVLSAPPTYSQLGGGSSTAAGLGGYSPVASNAGANPWSPKHSPLPMVIVGFIVGLWGLHWLYYKDKRKG
jgi:hypothetical protein